MSNVFLAQDFASTTTRYKSGTQHLLRGLFDGRRKIGVRLKHVYHWFYTGKKLDSL